MARKTQKELEALLQAAREMEHRILCECNALTSAKQPDPLVELSEPLSYAHVEERLRDVIESIRNIQQAIERFKYHESKAKAPAVGVSVTKLERIEAKRERTEAKPVPPMPKLDDLLGRVPSKRIVHKNKIKAEPAVSEVRRVVNSRVPLYDETSKSTFRYAEPGSPSAKSGSGSSAKPGSKRNRPLTRLAVRRLISSYLTPVSTGSEFFTLETGGIFRNIYPLGSVSTLERALNKLKKDAAEQGVQICFETDNRVHISYRVMFILENADLSGTKQDSLEGAMA